MLRTTKARLAASRQEEGGFTLIELMVVVLIIAILLAIAVPTFLGAQNKAKDRGAQSSLRNALTAAKTVQADKGTYADSTYDKLAAVEASLSYAAPGTESATAKNVSVAVSTDNTAWYGATKSATGKCFYIRDMSAGTTPGTQYASPTGSSVTCSGTAASTATGYTADGW